MPTPTPTHMTVADYCVAMERKEIKVNSNYQRSDKVWPPAAQSYLIESIILGFPMPKIYLHSVTDLRTRRTTRDIIDGQQRSKAILDYFQDKFVLSSKVATEDLKGRRYSDLDEGWQGKFLTYLISIDLFTGIEDHEVRDIFRRMNSYTVPLNPEELRHATYQGDFKWFINDLAQDFQDTLKKRKVLTEKAIVRMQDAKLLTEVSHAMDVGIRTTNKLSLNAIYAKYEEDFEEEGEFREALEYANGILNDLEVITNSNLNRAYIIYSMILAAVSHKREIPGLPNEWDEGEDVDYDMVAQNLIMLSDAMDLDEEDLADSPFEEFVLACSERTNVKDQRETRTRWFMRAFEEPLEG